MVYQLQEIPKQAEKRLSLQTGDEFEFMAEKINNMLYELDQLHQKMLTIEKEKWIFEKKNAGSSVQSSFSLQYT